MISARQEQVLRVLVASDSELRPSELVRRGAEAGHAIPRGTVYVTLGRMEDEGLVVSLTRRLDARYDAPLREFYAATPLGLRHLQALDAYREALRDA